MKLTGAQRSFVRNQLSLDPFVQTTKVVVYEKISSLIRQKVDSQNADKSFSIL